MVRQIVLLNLKGVKYKQVRLHVEHAVDQCNGLQNLENAKIKRRAQERRIM